jgi:hypothetical protein
MNDKTTIIFSYLFVIVPITLLFLHLYLPWAGKKIDFLVIRLILLHFGMFLCFVPLLMIDKNINILYISLHAGAAFVLSSTFIFTLMKSKYSENPDLESFLKKEGFRFKLQEYSFLFYRKTEISIKEFITTVILMLPISSIFLNNFILHIIFYFFMVIFLPIYGLFLYWAKNLENKFIK